MNVSRLKEEINVVHESQVEEDDAKWNVRS